MSRKLTTSMKWQQFAIVETTTADFLDHMRYDRACFFEEVDANMVREFLTNPGVYSGIKFLVTRWSEDKKSRWSLDRWQCAQTKLTPIDGSEVYDFQRELTKHSLEFVRLR